MIETHVIFLLLVVTLGYKKVFSQTLLIKKTNSGDCQEEKKNLEARLFLFINKRFNIQ